MSTTTAPRIRASRFDRIEDQVGSRFADVAAAAGRRTGRHLLHVLLFVTLVVCRDHTVLALADALQRAFGDSLGGVPALMLHTWAAGFDGLWDAIFAMLPTGGTR